MRRRTFLASSSGVLAALSGCAALGSSGQPAHTVSVYLSDRDATRTVSVTVNDADGSALFEREYTLSDSNEAHEDATFPESSEPETVVVTVDGTRFERPWPTDTTAQKCTGENWRGIEVSILGQPGEPPDIRLGANCQHVTTSGN